MWSFEEKENYFQNYFNLTIPESFFTSHIFDESNLEEYNLSEITFKNKLPNWEKEKVNSVHSESTSKTKELYDINSIIDILRKYIFEPNIREMLDQNNNIELFNQYRFICNKKKIKTKQNITTNFTTFNMKSKKRGMKRKPENKDIKTIHDKWTPDNILRKIKGKLFNEYILTFLNGLLGLQDKNAYEKLVKINYKKNITTKKKKAELEKLKMTLKKLISDKVSEEQKNLVKSHNESIIEKIEKNETINFVLDLTYNDFIDVFTHKKEIEEIKPNELRNNKIIKDNLPGVETMFKDLLEDSNYDIDYSLLVIFYLFNLKKSIDMKQDRNITKK